MIADTKQSITYFESVDYNLSQASIDDIEDIREELYQAGFLKSRQRDKRHKRKKPEQYLASDGKTILMVGRNNLQNEELTFKMAKKENSGSMLRISLEVMSSSKTILTQVTRLKLMLPN